MVLICHFAFKTMETKIGHYTFLHATEYFEFEHFRELFLGFRSVTAVAGASEDS